MTIAGAGSEPRVKVNSFNPQAITRNSLRGFVEADGYVSIEAEHYTKNSDGAAARWEQIADYGRTLSAMTILPCTAPSVTAAQWNSRARISHVSVQPG